MKGMALTKYSHFTKVIFVTTHNKYIPLLYHCIPQWQIYLCSGTFKWKTNKERIPNSMFNHLRKPTISLYSTSMAYETSHYKNYNHNFKHSFWTYHKYKQLLDVISSVSISTIPTYNKPISTGRKVGFYGIKLLLSVHQQPYRLQACWHDNRPWHCASWVLIVQVWPLRSISWYFLFPCKQWDIYGTKA